MYDLSAHHWPNTRLHLFDGLPWRMSYARSPVVRVPDPCGQVHDRQPGGNGLDHGTSCPSSVISLDGGQSRLNVGVIFGEVRPLVRTLPPPLFLLLPFPEPGLVWDVWPNVIHWHTLAPQSVFLLLFLAVMMEPAPGLTSVYSL